MEFSIKFDTVKSGQSIVYIEGSQVIISKKYISLDIDFSFNTLPHMLYLEHCIISINDSNFQIFTKNIF